MSYRARSTTSSSGSSHRSFHHFRSGKKWEQYPITGTRQGDMDARKLREDRADAIYLKR